jgi:hypothetical protein
MMGPCLTSAAPEAAPDAVFAENTATLKSEQLPQRYRGSIRRWRHAVLRFSKSPILAPIR